jgi:hypothetical protein
VFGLREGDLGLVLVFAGSWTSYSIVFYFDFLVRFKFAQLLGLRAD